MTAAKPHRRGKDATNDANRADRNTAIWERRKDGRTLQAIADEFDVGVSTVNDVCKKYLARPAEIAQESLALQLARVAEQIEVWRPLARPPLRNARGAAGMLLKWIILDSKLRGLVTTKVALSGSVDTSPVDWAKLTTEEINTMRELIVKGARQTEP